MYWEFVEDRLAGFAFDSYGYRHAGGLGHSNRCFINQKTLRRECAAGDVALDMVSIYGNGVVDLDLILQRTALHDEWNGFRDHVEFIRTDRFCQFWNV